MADALVQSNKPTPEQARVIASKGNRVRVVAYAGTGKTTTAVAYTEARPKERFLMMAYNAAIASAASAKFPEWVECKTMHSIAWGAVVPKIFAELGRPNPAENHEGWNAKLGDMRPITIAASLQINSRMARLIKATLDAWTCSPDIEITEKNIPADLKVPFNQQSTVVELARQLWKNMQDPKLLEFKMPHDGYLKLWQLQTPDLTRRYTAIICDEAQDLNPTVLDVLNNKHQRKLGLLVIGDENQAIYQFRGATNAMNEIDVDETHYLTTSFRFGSGVAAVATALLGTFRKLPRPITGLGERTRFEIDRDKSYCTISRTNAVLFDAAVSALDSNRPFYFIGATKKGVFDKRAYRFDAMMDVYYLSLGQRSKIRDSTLGQFENLAELIEAAKDTDDRELKFLAKIADTYGERIPELIQQLEDRHVLAPEPKSFMKKHPNGLLFTTAHKSKGLEFEQVALANDFFELTDDKENLLAADNVPVEELNLLYVAATRAECALSLNDSIKGALRAIQREDRIAKASSSAGMDEKANRSARATP